MAKGDEAHAADIRSQVNEKLLKALISLLAMRDENLLEELTIIFDLADRANNEVGTGPKEVWTRVHHQMGVLQDVLDRAVAEDAAAIPAH